MYNVVMKNVSKILSALILTSAFTVSGILLPACAKGKQRASGEISDGQTVPEWEEQTPSNGGEFTIDPDISPDERQNTPSGGGENAGANGGDNGNAGGGENEQGNSVPAVTVPGSPGEAEQPESNMAEYIRITADGVNIRSGAGTGYSSLGVAEKNTLYAVKGKTGNWYKTVYRHSTAYISANYCTAVDMDKCANEELETVIEKGYECLGVPYVYGAVRYMDGNGNRLGGFTKDKFDCSSLMQYVFKLGAGVNLQVNTRTQIYQGTTVSKSNLRRGDLIFFTNASRKNLTGIERVGHVALYLGDNYILHTASDYAKIEQISTTRWGYFIQAQRILW